MVTSESEDEQLVRAFQRGDDVACSIFVQRHQDRVYRVATMWLIDFSLASEMFPADELSRLAEPSPDIVGRTDVDSVFAALADWVEPGSSSAVFPGIVDARIEQGVNLGDGIFLPSSHRIST